MNGNRSTEFLLCLLLDIAVALFLVADAVCRVWRTVGGGNAFDATVWPVAFMTLGACGMTAFYAWKRTRLKLTVAEKKSADRSAGY